MSPDDSFPVAFTDRVPQLLHGRHFASLAAVSLACLALPSASRAGEPEVLCGDDFSFSFLPPSTWSDEWDPTEYGSLLTLITFSPGVGAPGGGKTRIEIGLAEYGSNVHPPEATERFVASLNHMISVLADFSTNPPDEESLLRAFFRSRAFSVSHPRYPASALLAANQLGVHRYVSFVDPRGYAGYLISVILFSDDSPATAGQLATFRSVIRSLDYDPMLGCEGPLDMDPSLLREIEAQGR